MSAVTSREKNMLLVTVVLVLYAAAALTFKKQIANWKAAERIYRAAQKKVQDEKDLIAASGEWSQKYGRIRDLMPVFPYGKDVDTHWLNIMDSVAERNGVAISRRQTGVEKEVGDVFELPIDCKDWEASLESLVKFLYDMSQEGAMLDVRQLTIRPSNRPGYLKGSFVLYCAYMSGDAEKPPAGAPASAARQAGAAASGGAPEAGRTEELPAEAAPAAVEPDGTAGEPGMTGGEAPPAPGEPAEPQP